MGIFFTREPSTASLRSLEEALATPPPASPDEVKKKAVELATAAEQPAANFNTKGFLIAVGLLLLFLAVAVLMDVFNWADDSTAYTGLVSTVLGAVLGFIGGEASGAATNK